MELLTTAQIERESGFHRETINLAAREGRLVPFIQSPARNGARFFTREAVDAWLAERTRKPYRRYVAD